MTAEQEIGVQEIKGIETLMRRKMGKKEKKGYLRNTDGSTPLQVLISPDRSDTSCILWCRVESNWVYSIIYLTLIGTISFFFFFKTGAYTKTFILADCFNDKYILYIVPIYMHIIYIHIY